MFCEVSLNVPVLALKHSMYINHRSCQLDSLHVFIVADALDLVLWHSLAPKLNWSTVQFSSRVKCRCLFCSFSSMLKLLQLN